MKIETKFNVGDIVYYVCDYDVKITRVYSFKIEYSNYHGKIQIDYVVKSDSKYIDKIRIYERDLFKSKKALLDYLDSICLKEKLSLLRKN